MIRILLFVFSLLYPLSVYFYPLWTDYVLFAIGVLWCLSGIMDNKKTRYKFLLSGLIFLILILKNTFDNAGLLVFLYPSIIGVMVGSFFILSLKDVAIITYFAQKEHQYKGLPPLDAQRLQYTRKMTKIWAGFIFFNAFLCFALAFWDKKIWGFYSSVGIYITMLILFFGERIFRMLFLEKKWSK